MYDNKKTGILKSEILNELYQQNTRVLKVYTRTAMEILDYVRLRNYDKECMGHKICVLLALKRCFDIRLSESATEEIQERMEDLAQEIDKKCGTLMTEKAWAYEVHSPEDFLRQLDSTFENSLAVKIVLAFISNNDTHKYFVPNDFKNDKEHAFDLIKEMQAVLEKIDE